MGITKKNFILLGLIAIINLIFNAKFQLHYDESYYWVWGQNLSLSYYDHPPMIAYLSRLSSYLGHSEFWVRLPAFITTLITFIFIYKLTKRMFNAKVANTALTVSVSCLMYSGTAFILTPDSPLLMFWTITLYYFYIATFERKRAVFYIAGIFAGFALLSKYIAIFIFPSLFLFLIFSPKHRHILLKPDIYLAFILSWLIFSPVIIWNYYHNWDSFRFQYLHGIKPNQIFNFNSFLDYLGGQLIISNPILFVSFLYFVCRYFKLNFRNDKLAFLLFPSIFVLLFFGIRSFFQHMEANWVIVSYTSGFIFLSYWLDKMQNRFIYRSSLFFIFIIIAVAKFPTWCIPSMYKGKIPALNAFFGGKETLSYVPQYIKDNIPLLACDYANASRAWFYLGSKVYVLNNLPYANTYKYWNDELSMPIKQAIYICDSDDKNAFNALKDNFKIIKLLDVISFSNEIVKRKLYIYKAYN